MNYKSQFGAIDNFDRSKSLQEIEGVDWGEPQYESYVVTNAYRLRRVPLQNYTVDDLRFMIGQRISPQYLVPMALECLQADPWIEAFSHRGDLLSSLLKADSRFWIASPHLRARTEEIALRAISLLPTLDEDERPQAEEAFAAAYDIFKRAEYFAQHGRAY